MAQEAKRLGINVSDEELKESIELNPAFQVGAQFDARIYERSPSVEPDESGSV